MLSRLLLLSNTLINRADSSIKNIVNTTLDTVQPSTIAATTAEAVLLSREEYQLATYLVTIIASVLQVRDTMQLYKNWDTSKILGNLLDRGVLTAKDMPIAGEKVEELIIDQIKNMLKPVKEKTDKIRAELGIEPIERLPKKGMTAEEIRDRLKPLQKYYKKGTNTGTVYGELEEELKELLKFIFGETALTNPLHPIWPLINEMEAELFSICKNIFNGPDDTHGILTHGGTSSIIEACNAYVQYAKDVLHIKTPKIIVPESIHVAFDDKTKKLLGANLVPIPVDPKTGRADVEKMEAAITDDTILLVGSAPCFPFGKVDPIKELAEVAKKHNIFLHVDACLGGFLYPFANKDKFKIPECDFSIDGVNSISADIHKFGLGVKGTSIALFRNKNLFSPTTTFSKLNWKGGLYVTPGYLDGSRSGAMVAMALAVLLFYGEDRYKEIADSILTTTQQLVEELRKIDGITIPYDPDLSVIYMRTKPGVNHHLLTEKFEEPNEKIGKIGWSVNDMSHGFHFCITYEHAKDPEFISKFVRDMKEAVNYVKEHPNEKPKGLAKAYKYIDTGLLPPVVQSLVGNVYQLISKTLPGKLIPRFWNTAPMSSNKEENIVTNNQIGLYDEKKLKMM